VALNEADAPNGGLISQIDVSRQNDETFGAVAFRQPGILLSIWQCAKFEEGVSSIVFLFS